RQQEEAQKRDADQVIKDYVQLLNGLSVTFDKTTTVELVRERRDELLYQLNSIIAHNKNTVLAALATLQIDGELPQINAAIAEKTMAINSMAQQLEEHILKEQRQRQQEEAQKRDADQVIKDYVQLLNGLPVTFDKATTVELVDERRDELLHQLSTIIAHNKSEVLAALATLQINGEPPQITAAIIEKTTAINSLAQQVVLQIQLAEEHHFEQERLRTQSIQEEPYRQSELNTDSSSLSNISMMILGGFIATAGIAAVAIAFTVLNAATLGIPGIVVACIGVAAALSGIGLFATGTYKNRTIIPEELTNITNEIVFQ
ncbi:hypothetical protein MJ258_04460, partial [Legionella sp. EUR-108]|nr:hypothetical protein [Legionella maioricensis]